MFEEKKRLFEEYIVDLITNSFFDDMSSWTHAPNLNCYAFARGLTYPDFKHQFYSPGKIYQMKFGKGPVLKNESNLRFIDRCIQNDSIALKQKCPKVSFKDIKENDGYFYFAVTKFHLLHFSNDYHWHFICRTPNGLWLHKPNWCCNVQTLDWVEYGKTFRFSIDKVIEIDKHKLSLQKTSNPITYEGLCFEDYFYRLELPED